MAEVGRKTRVEDNFRAVKFNEFLMDKGITVFSTESMENSICITKRSNII